MKGTERAAAAGKKAMSVLEKYKFVLLILLVGLLLLLLPAQSETGKEASAERTGETVQVAFSLSELEEKLEKTLSKIDGAGEVTVALALRTGPRQILAQDTTGSDRNGDRSEERTTVVISGGSGREEAVTLQQMAPQLQGAVVVCPGGDDPGVQLKLAEAVSDLTGLGADKISICKGK
ncbi:stage III sporulation protein AG [Intestinimonas sp.]|uniref:stage III sporulation protein AG n=1 Tax=Intestinimonas sp. TaxID=1965293 RepID=UPI00260BBB21|nr:stage III sporulation protein AG [Intestinimonas sp.]